MTSSTPFSFVSTIAFVLALALFVSIPASAFYLPGIAPVDYEEGASLSIFANKVTSSKTHIPYDYYSLPFCKPEGQEEKKKIKSAKRLNLGQLLVGEKMKPTKYEVNMMVEENCKQLCTRTANEKQVEQLIRRITESYLVRLNLDNMPGVSRVSNPSAPQTWAPGYKLGQIENDHIQLNNHLAMNILVHKPTITSSDIYQPEKTEIWRIVGFEVTPYSAAPGTSCPTNNAAPFLLQHLEEGKEISIPYTYSVKFEQSPIRWATRWDSLLKASETETKIQWFSIMNSVAVSLFMTVIVAVIMLQTIYKDFARYNNLDTDHGENAAEDYGWKLVHGDVFRTPTGLGPLVILFGTGVQVLFVFCITCGFALMGVLSPANRGGLLTVLLLVVACTNIINGYSAARLYVGLGGKQKKTVTIGASMFLPSVVFSIFFFLNLLATGIKSASAVPVFTLLMLCGLWFGLSIPLNVIGSYLGYLGEPFATTARVSQIPRKIPQGTLPIVSGSIAALGLFPFLVIFIELNFILNSLWLGAIFYMFGFLTLIFLLGLFASAEAGTIVTYLTLSYEDYRWWWPALLVGTSTGPYIFIYCIVYLHKTIGIRASHFVSLCMYLGYSFIISLAMGLMLGAVSFFFSFLFVRKLYSSIRVD